MTQHRESQDWYQVDREEWQQKSGNGAEVSLNPANSFASSAKFNTENSRPQEYSNVLQRRDYYDLMSYVLEHDKFTPATLKNIKFFHAATKVTSLSGIAGAETIGGALLISSPTRDILRKINTKLFEHNIGVLNSLIFKWKEPRSPLENSAKVDALTFDLKMVEKEQSLVEEYLKAHLLKLTPTVSDEIDAALNFKFPFATPEIQWAKKACSTDTLSFMKKDHRIAIGKALIFLFHKKTEAEFLAAMKK